MRAPDNRPADARDVFGGRRESEILKVLIPGLLRSYTGGAESVVLSEHATLDEALRDLNARYPGLRFRVVDEQDAIRPHIKMFIDGALARRLDTPLEGSAELMIVGALSGG